MTKKEMEDLTEAITVSVSSAVQKQQQFTPEEVFQIKSLLKMWGKAKEITGKTVLTAIILALLAALAVGIKMRAR